MHWTDTPVHFEAISLAGAYARNVKLGDKWGRIAPDGHWLIEPKFDYLSADEGLLVAGIDGNRSFLSLYASWLIEPRFDAARLIKRSFDPRLLGRPEPDSAFVTISGETGLLRLNDQSWTIPPRPGVMCDIPDTNAILWQAGSKLAILSLAGETWYEIEADRIGPVREGGLIPFLRNGKWGLVDTAGQVMVEPQFDKLALCARYRLGQARRALVRHRSARQSRTENRLHRCRPRRPWRRHLAGSFLGVKALPRVSRRARMPEFSGAPICQAQHCFGTPALPVGDIRCAHSGSVELVVFLHVLHLFNGGADSSAGRCRHRDDEKGCVKEQGIVLQLVMNGG